MNEVVSAQLGAWASTPIEDALLRNVQYAEVLEAKILHLQHEHHVTLDRIALLEKAAANAPDLALTAPVPLRRTPATLLQIFAPIHRLSASIVVSCAMAGTLAMLSL